MQSALPLARSRLQQSHDAICRAGARSALVWALAALGCSPLGRISDCERVVETLNPGLLEIQRLTGNASTAAAYRQIADAYEELGKRLSALLPKDPDLSKALASYRELTQRAAKHSRAFSDELSKEPSGDAGVEGDPAAAARMDRIRSGAKTELAREATLVRKLNALCHP